MYLSKSPRFTVSIPHVLLHDLREALKAEKKVSLRLINIEMLRKFRVDDIIIPRYAEHRDYKIEPLVKETKSLICYFLD